MVTKIREAYPDATSVREAPLPELATAVLQHLAQGKMRGNGTDCIHNFSLEMKAEYGGDVHAVSALAEAWGWLENRDLLCPHSQHGPGWLALTRLGHKLAEEHGLRQWLQDRELPDEFVHTRLRLSLQLFRQGHFDTAVFEAFKELEVSIRRAAGLGEDLIGRSLASRAFHPENGELTDRAAELGERTALQSLMVGAIGSYKNPHSHRRVGVGAAEAREMIIMASHLLRIVDDRAPHPSESGAS